MAEGGVGPRTADATADLWYSICGGRAAAWFSQIDPGLRGLHPRYRWSVRAVSWASRLTGVPCRRSSTCHWTLRSPSPGGCGRPWPRARRRTSGHSPLSRRSPSAGRRRKPGSILQGPASPSPGEPVTAARLAAIRQAGAVAVPDYGSADSGGSVTYGCLRLDAPDDVHLFQDLNALVRRTRHRSRPARSWCPPSGGPYHSSSSTSRWVTAPP